MTNAELICLTVLICWTQLMVVVWHKRVSLEVGKEVELEVE